MRTFLQLLFLCLPFLSYSQIAFEYVPNPNDFSIGAVRKSPTGEYFVQAADDMDNIYTSLDGVTWTKTPMPFRNKLDVIQFYADGTPVLHPQGDADLIRRNGIWYTMDTGEGDLAEASFIKGDTLFVYNGRRFAYSLDKGQTFITAITFDGNLTDHSSLLWKFDSYYVLFADSKDRLSVFNLNGELVLRDTLDLFSGEVITYSSCGEILFNNNDHYYLLQEDLTYQSGPTADIIPQFVYGDLMSEGSNYYSRNGNRIYKTNGCNFDWHLYAANDVIDSKENIWVDDQGEVFLYSTYDDFFTIQSNGTAVKLYPDIHYPHVMDVSESTPGYQFSLTANAIFSKSIGDNNWYEMDSIGTLESRVQFSPGGGLYIPREKDILYSSDNGHSFSSIPLPHFVLSIRNYSLKVLQDNVLFLVSENLGRGFYTLNNGQDWIDTGESLYSDAPEMKLIGDEILIADVDYNLIFTKINVTTNETISESFDPITGAFASWAAILDDGTIYLQTDLISGSSSYQYYRFRFGEGLNYLGSFQQLDRADMASSGNNLYAFASNNYYLYDGDTFIEHSYTGLPFNSGKQFILSANQYLYFIYKQNEIYRSTQPLSLQVATKETAALIDFNVFPNPAYDELTLVIDESDLKRIDSYEIIDQLGGIVERSGYLNKQVINVSGLNAGYYMVVLKGKGKVVGMKRFVKV